MNKTFRKWCIAGLFSGFIGIFFNLGVSAMFLLEPTPTLTPPKTEKTTTPTKSPISSPRKSNEAVNSETPDDKKANPAPVETPTPKPLKEEGFNWIGLIYYLAIGLLSLLVIGGLVTLVLLFRSSWQKFRAGTDSRLMGLETKARQHSEENRQLKKTVEVLSNQIVEQKKSFNNLAQRLSERTQSSSAQPVNYAPPPPREEPIFPISSENYQIRFGSSASSATVDPLTGFLIEDPGKGDEFLLVRDTALGGEQRYVVPNIRRFSTKNDYLNYYQNFYACENPSGGTVWIKSPTVVRRVSEGWQLEIMGELEIRM